QGTGAAEGVPGTTGQNRILASVKPSRTAREHPRFEESESAWRVTAAMATARPTSTGLPTSLASGCETRRDLAFKPKGLCMAKNTICLWYDKDAEAAARFYAETFPDSVVGAIHRAPSNYPSGKAGDVLVVEFTVAGVPCIGLNGGPAFKHHQTFSFQIATDDQHETDRYWNAIVGNGGQESECGWCKDKWGVSWQITPRVLTEALAAGGDEAKRAFDAMMGMKKIDVAAI